MAVRGLHAPVADTDCHHRSCGREGGGDLGKDSPGLAATEQYRRTEATDQHRKTEATDQHRSARKEASLRMITESDVQEMLDSRDLIAIGVRADDVRRGLNGVRATFVRVFEVQLDAPPA